MVARGMRGDARAVGVWDFCEGCAVCAVYAVRLNRWCGTVGEGIVTSTMSRGGCLIAGLGYLALFLY